MPGLPKASPSTRLAVLRPTPGKVTPRRTASRGLGDRVELIPGRRSGWHPGPDPAARSPCLPIPRSPSAGPATSSIRLIPHGWGDIHPRNLGLRMRTIRRAARPPVSDQQEHLVIRIRPRMRRLGQERCRPGHGGGYSLSRRDQHVRGQGNQQRRQALGVAPIPRQRHQPEQVIRSAGILPGNRRSSPLALFAAHKPVLTQRAAPVRHLPSLQNRRERELAGWLMCRPGGRHTLAADGVFRPTG